MRLLSDSVNTRVENRETRHLSRHGLGLGKKTTDDTKQQIPLTLIAIEATDHRERSKRALEEIQDWSENSECIIFPLDLNLPSFEPSN